MEAVCAKCAKRKRCKVPCYPVEQYLKRENLTVFEKKQPNDTIMVFPRSREQHQSYFTGDIELTKINLAFSTDNDAPWSHYEPNFKYTRVLMQKLEGMSFGEISDFHRVDRSTVIKNYYKAAEKIMSLILKIDQPPKAMSPAERSKRQNEAAKKYYDRNLKRPRELRQDKKSVAKREHYQIHKEAIKAKRRAYYQENKERINAKRRKRSDRNKEKINAKRRETYAMKNNA